LLAASDRTTPAAKKLIAAGEPIDQRDNEKLTALAYALQDQNLAAAKRLLTLGSSGHAGWGDRASCSALTI
jgi:ankyrin repeat protein